MGPEVSRITLAWAWVAKLFIVPALAGANAAGSPSPVVNSKVEIRDTDCRDTSQQGIRRVSLVNQTNECEASVSVLIRCTAIDYLCND